MIEVRESPGRGRGVFATRRIPEGEVICCDPVVVISGAEMAALTSTVLGNYWWHWGIDYAVAFGAASMVNDDDAPNATNRTDHAGRLMGIVATRDIRAGEEITLDYSDLNY